MSKVYVVNKGPHDYSPAEAFGRLIYCTDGAVDRFDTAQMYREMADALRDSQPDDYLLLTSLTSLCCVACAIFALKHRRLNLLLHSPRDGYVERTLFFGNLFT